MPLSQRNWHSRGRGAPTVPAVFPGTARLSVWARAALVRCRWFCIRAFPPTADFVMRAS